MLFRSKTVMFENSECQATVYQVSSSFHSRGLLGTMPATVGIFLLRMKYMGSDKLVAPLSVTVSSYPFLSLV